MPPPLSHLLDHTSPWVGVLLVVLLVACGLWSGLRIARLTVDARVRRSRRLGRAGEARALALLAREGWEILDREVTARGVVQVDGVPYDYVVRADALVERDGVRCVAELKGGEEAAQITTRATRRQLLEYAWVFDVDGLLLVDAVTERVLRIQFPARQAAPPRA